MTTFSELMDGMRREGDAWTAAVSDDWLQSRTLFGGLSGSLCLEAVKREFSDLPPLRSAQFSLTGPAAGTITIRPALLRRGKSTAFVCADLSGDSGLAMRATFCFTSPRASAYSHEAIPAPAVKPPDQCPTFARQVNFAQHFDNRLAHGNSPFSEADDPTMVLWMRLREEVRSTSQTALVALADSPPPAAQVLFKQQTPISTMTWTLDILSDDFETEDGWWLIRASAESVLNGYSSQAMTVWNSIGKPVLVGRQNIAIFA
jgi:acyl-CoA thioesterase